MSHVSLIRSTVRKEGDQERGAYAVKTGFRPDPTVVHSVEVGVRCVEVTLGGRHANNHAPRRDQMR